ncbi:unnamed protein product [Cuscuta epithymum]|uniref:GRF-type domain-containing protein n=1 Tax=Cuscuta epithymum TaxID=186058 RepID=A0AAV0FF52_9ASTE|nr:unnamed protein product [Cuscuta epithymum]
MTYCNSNEAQSTITPSSKSISKVLVKCDHGMVSALKTVTFGPNKGKKFYGCPLWQSDNCNFFLWEHDSKKMESRVSMDTEKQSVLDENEKLRKELEAMKIENKILLEKICKLRMKKKLLEADRRKVNSGKKAMCGVVLSWVVIAIVVSILVGRM